MLCDKCKKNEATVSIMTTINGVSKKQNLCQACAEEEGVFESAFNSLPIPNYIGQSAFSLPFSLANLFGQLDQGQVTKTLSYDVCPDCGQGIGDFQQSGLFGCPSCYSHFRTWIEPMLDEIQGSHSQLELAGELGDRGVDLDPSAKDEVKDQSLSELDSRLADLQAQLKDLVKQEHYEEAALVRDQIKAVKEGEQAKGDGSNPAGQVQDKGE